MTEDSHDDVWQKIQDGYYKTKLPWPEYPKAPGYFYKNLADMTSEEVASLAGDQARLEAAQDVRTSAKQSYMEDQRRLNALFQIELEAEAGMTGNPRAGKLWTKAYDRGHSNGASEIYNEYMDLLELVK